MHSHVLPSQILTVASLEAVITYKKVLRQSRDSASSTTADLACRHGACNVIMAFHLRLLPTYQLGLIRSKLAGTQEPQGVHTWEPSGE